MGVVLMIVVGVRLVVAVVVVVELSGQLSMWNRKTLAQNEYHIYRRIPLHTHDYLTN